MAAIQCWRFGAGMTNKMSRAGPRPAEAGAGGGTESEAAGGAPAGQLLAADAWAVLTAAASYVIHKAADGVTVGLWFGPDAHGRTAYGEGRSPAGNLDDAIRQAWARIRQAGG